MARLRDQRHIAYQMPAPHPGMGMFQQWINYEPEYTLHPGDQLDIVVSSAPELSRTLTVGPDGRVVMPMSKPIMAAGRTFTQVQNELSAELAKQLRDPTIAVTPRAYSPEQIYVGGQVGQPGTYTMPGRIGALEALMMAGGMRPTARARQVAVLRRAPNGGMMMRTVNIRNGLLNIREYDDNMQLRRGDIIFVPQSNIAEIGTWMQNFRNALPVDFNVSYQFGANNGGTTVVSP
jgi:polysaccharide export outer membrane protein